MYTKKEAIKELRAEAKKRGLTFREMKNVRLNGVPVYELVIRESGRRLVHNYRLSTAYEDMLSGYWDTL